MKQKVLIVTRDNMPFQGLLPIAQRLYSLGCPLHVCAEEGGVSVDKWRSTGKFQYTVCGRDTDPESIIDAVKPTHVLVGFSNPIGLEDTVSHCANRHSIPVFAYSDTWGASSRMKMGKPEVIFTIDQIDSGLASLCMPRSEVISVGDWINQEDLVPKNLWPQSGKKSLLIAGQHPDTIKDFVTTALERMENPNSWQVVFRSHPKWSTSEQVQRALIILQSGVEVLNLDLDTDSLAKSAEVVLSGFSGVLRTAALASRCGVSVETEWLLDFMESSTGLRTYPLVTTGACLGTSKSFTLEDALKSGAYTKACAQYVESVWPHKLKYASDLILNYT